MHSVFVWRSHRYPNETEADEKEAGDKPARVTEEFSPQDLTVEDIVKYLETKHWRQYDGLYSNCKRFAKQMFGWAKMDPAKRNKKLGREQARAKEKLKRIKKGRVGSTEKDSNEDKSGVVVVHFYDV